MNESPWIVVVAVLLAPVLLAAVNAVTRRSERKAEWARQDRVADRLMASQDIVADRLLTSQKRVADRLYEHNDRVAETARAANRKLDVIHTLVNSNMTTAMEAELRATEREYVMMIEVVDLKRVSGTEPTQEVLTAIAATEAKISEMRSVLEDRMNQG